MESSALNFQSALQLLTFKTLYHNQAQQFGYDNLFLNQRVVVFSMPTMFGHMSKVFLKSFDTPLPNIDNTYCISSYSPLVGPWADKHSSIMGLYEPGEFSCNIAKQYGIDKPVRDITMFWQYIIILNNGVPEKFWHNPVKADMSFALFKNPKYAFHGLSVEKVKEYLASCN